MIAKRFLIRFIKKYYQLYKHVNNVCRKPLESSSNNFYDINRFAPDIEKWLDIHASFISIKGCLNYNTLINAPRKDFIIGLSTTSIKNEVCNHDLLKWLLSHYLITRLQCISWLKLIFIHLYLDSSKLPYHYPRIAEPTPLWRIKS